MSVMFCFRFKQSDTCSINFKELLKNFLEHSRQSNFQTLINLILTMSLLQKAYVLESVRVNGNNKLLFHNSRMVILTDE